MRKWIAIALLGGAAMLGGCKSEKTTMGGKVDPAMQARLDAVDVCPTCPGVQKVSDGKCSGCGMAISDACPKCAGVQPAAWMSAGQCPTCALGAHGQPK